MTHLNLNYVFDIGHAHIGAGIEHEFEIMKPRIRSLHVHDNDGKEDQHLFPDERRRHHRLDDNDGTAALVPRTVSSASRTARSRRDAVSARRNQPRLRPAGSPSTKPMPERITIAAIQAGQPYGSDRRNCGLAVQPAQVRQDRLPDSARWHGAHPVRRAEERAAGRCLRGTEAPDAGIVAHRARQGSRGSPRAGRL